MWLGIGIGFLIGLAQQDIVQFIARTYLESSGQ